MHPSREWHQHIFRVRTHCDRVTVDRCTGYAGGGVYLHDYPLIADDLVITDCESFGGRWDQEKGDGGGGNLSCNSEL